MPTEIHEEGISLISHSDPERMVYLLAIYNFGYDIKDLILFFYLFWI
jgi:hypothetical protein